MQPDINKLLEQLNYSNPLIVGCYDTPDPQAFQPYLTPRHCVFEAWENWSRGETVHLTGEKPGCFGAGYWLCNVQRIERDKFIQFLNGKEGLKASADLMGSWLDSNRPYEPEHGHILIGPLRPDQYQWLKTVTFFLPPDQLSFMIFAAQYHSASDDPSPSIVPFGSGCGQMLALFEDPAKAQAIVGATDLAMRKHLPENILAFTVTRPMFERFADLDENSFMYKPFWTNLCDSRSH